MDKYQGIEDVKIIEKLAKQGDKDAIYEMVWRLDQSDLMLPEHRENQVERSAWQKYWYKKAADAGHSIAACRYAKNMYGYKLCFDPDYQQEAMKYFQLIVNDCDSGKLITEEEKDWGVTAKLFLGIMLCEGYHTPRDAKKGVKLIEEAKELNKKGFEDYGFSTLRELGEIYGGGYTQPDEDPSSTDVEQAIKYLEAAIDESRTKKENPKNVEQAKKYLAHFRDTYLDFKKGQEADNEKLAKDLKKEKEKKLQGLPNLYDEMNEAYKLLLENKKYTNLQYAKKRREEKEKVVLPDFVRSQMEEDKAAFKKLTQRLAQKGWDNIPIISKSMEEKQISDKKYNPDFEKYIDDLKIILNQDLNREKFKDFYKQHNATFQFFNGVDKSAKDILHKPVIEVVDFMQLETKLPLLTELKSKISFPDYDMSSSFKDIINQTISYIKNEMLVSEIDDTAKQFFDLLKKNKQAYIDEEKEKDKKAQYDKLVEAKNKALTENEFQKLAKQFRGLNYDDSSKLADDCDNQYFILKACREEQKRLEYTALINAKNAASTEKEFQDLANKFRELDYEDSLQLEGECYKKYLELKECREKEERNVLFDNACRKLKQFDNQKRKKADEYHDLSQKYKELSNEFSALAYYYTDASVLADECINKSGIASAKAKRIEKRARKRPFIITLFAIILIIITALYGFLNGWFKEVREYSEGMAAVNYGRSIYPKWGFIDESGKEVIPRIYSDVLDFSEGLASVNLDGKRGYIDKSGNVVIDFKYNWAASFSNGIAKVSEKDEDRSTIWGLIDRNGRPVTPIKYQRIHDFDDDLAMVYIVGTNRLPGNRGVSSTIPGVINRSGEEVIPCIHHSVVIRDEFIEVVTMSDETQYFDKSGKRINYNSSQQSSETSNDQSTTLTSQDTEATIDTQMQETTPSSQQENSGNSFGRRLNNRVTNARDNTTQGNDNTSSNSTTRNTISTRNAISSSTSVPAFSTRLLREADLRGKSKQELRFLRNEIYARHGYKFNTRDLQEYFSEKDWYSPQYDDVDHLLNDFERENIKFIERHE